MTIANYEQQKTRIPTGNLIEVNYADLIADPFTQLLKVYQVLNLKGFEDQEEPLKQYIEAQKHLQVNTKTFYEVKS